ncbi:protrudin-like isoform X1 [Lytechinus variegatus]|uniref:protrudin-like isoform X1 n=1 Tax=Lytechinus variegatus TaxID=7654 RepID=UPI001BB22148|nr:protrudin-like isoform X1 [Lytechinus variegatus]
MADSSSIHHRPVIRPNQRPATPPILSHSPPSSTRSNLSPAPSRGLHTTKASNSRVVYEKAKPNRDVGKLVDAYRNIQMLSWPLVLCYEFISTVFSWDYPILTIGVWIILQLFSFYMTTGQLVVVCFLMLFVIASLGYLTFTSQYLTEKHNSSKKRNVGNLQSSSSSSSSPSASTSSSSAAQVQSPTPGSSNPKLTKAGDSQKAKIPLSSSPPKVAASLPGGDGCLATPHHEKIRHKELEIDSQRKRELLSEYCQMMQDLNRWLTTVSRLLLWMEDMLLWRCRWKTILFYLTLYTGVLCILYVPFCWITMATSNYLILSHPRCSVGFEKIKRWITIKMDPSQANKDESSNHLENSDENDPADLRLQNDRVVSSHPLSDDVNGNEDTDEEVQKEKRLKTTQGVVPAHSRPDSAPATQQHQPKKFESGMCYLCGTPFTSVLKRRRYCRYCGRDFCPKCCSKKLPRSALGATAPAAQTEKELVCNLCVIKLTGEEVGGNKVR